MSIFQVLGSISSEEFLRDYWQKKPLLIRQAIAGFASPLSPEELAGLACEEDVPARLILESAGERPWMLRQGPFTEEDFTSLPEEGYSLLVTDCEKLIPDLMALVERFRFVPDWRIDDLMISYAPTGGSVGAHIDEYDVFLLQGLGTRRWLIEYPPKNTHFVPDLDIRLLEQFEPTDEWVLEPGDMLYLPPGVPHHGIALEPCMTYSIGFRAPLLHELAAGVTDRLITHMNQTARYADCNLEAGANPGTNPGALTLAARTQLRGLLHNLLNQDDAVFDQFLAETLTERPMDHAAFYPENEPLDAAALKEELTHSGDTLMRTPAARLLLVEGACPVLAVDGLSIALNEETRPLAELITRQVFFDTAQLLALIAAPAAAELLAKLYADGVVQWRPHLLEV